MADLECLQCRVAKSQIERNERVTIGTNFRPLANVHVDRGRRRCATAIHRPLCIDQPVMLEDRTHLAEFLGITHIEWRGCDRIDSRHLIWRKLSARHPYRLVQFVGQVGRMAIRDTLLVWASRIVRLARVGPRGAHNAGSLATANLN